MSEPVAPPERLEARRGVFYLLAYGFFSGFALAGAFAQFSPGYSPARFPANWVIGAICAGVAAWLAREAFRMRPRSRPILVLDENGLEHVDLGRLEWPAVQAVSRAEPLSMLTGSELYVRLKPRDLREQVAADLGRPQCWVIPLRGLDRSEAAIGETARGYKQWAESLEPEPQAPMSLEELGEMARQTGDPAAVAMHERLVEASRRNDEVIRRAWEGYDRRVAQLARRSRVANWILGILLVPAFLFLFYVLLKARVG